MKKSVVTLCLLVVAVASLTFTTMGSNDGTNAEYTSSTVTPLGDGPIEPWHDENY